MTDLSVIIVSYNVRAFLEQCLVSVERAKGDMSMDVWVVDNRSVDGSVDMVRERFPWVQVISNEENLGFSKANNQALRVCAGRNVLLLNPDTVVREDTFRKCLSHAHNHPKLGGMGVPMYDGKGKYLPESKRGLPTPWAAFCRMSGLHRIASRSKQFNAYYAGHVGEQETAEVDILSGAFMWMNKVALDEVGLLDEQFFMYGEDIDLSWRLIEGGWENHYFAETSIIHYKGESTKKGSLNYVMVFYRAMLLFAAKHFEGRQARAFSWMIRSAIYGRAALAVIRRGISRWGDLIRVATATMLALTLVMVASHVWLGKSFVWPDAGWQGAGLLAVQLACMWAGGGYRDARAMRGASRHVLSWLVASLVTLATYSLFPESWRFSRAVVLVLLLLHALIHTVVMVRALKRNGNPYHIRRLLVARDDVVDMADLLRRNEGERVRLSMNALWAGKDAPQDLPQIQGVPWVGRLRDVEEAVQIHNIDEVVFSGKDVRTESIVDALPMLGKHGVKCRIAWTDVGDVMSSGGASREAFVAFQRGLHRPEVARSKRVFDVVFAFLVLFTAPAMWATGRIDWVRFSVRVIVGNFTWVSPGNLQMPVQYGLELSEGLPGKAADRKAFTHAQDYHWRKDLSVVADALISRRAIISYGNH